MCPPRPQPSPRHAPPAHAPATAPPRQTGGRARDACPRTGLPHGPAAAGSPHISPPAACPRRNRIPVPRPRTRPPGPDSACRRNARAARPPRPREAHHPVSPRPPPPPAVSPAAPRPASAPAARTAATRPGPARPTGTSGSCAGRPAAPPRWPAGSGGRWHVEDGSAGTAAAGHAADCSERLGVGQGQFAAWDYLLRTHCYACDHRSVYQYDKYDILQGIRGPVFLYTCVTMTGWMYRSPPSKPRLCCTPPFISFVNTVNVG